MIYSSRVKMLPWRVTGKNSFFAFKVGLNLYLLYYRILFDSILHSSARPSIMVHCIDLVKHYWLCGIISCGIIGCAALPRKPYRLTVSLEAIVFNSMSVVARDVKFFHRTQHADSFQPSLVVMTTNIYLQS